MDSLESPAETAYSRARSMDALESIYIIFRKIITSDYTALLSE